MVAVTKLLGLGMPAGQANQLGANVQSKTGVGTAQSGSTPLAANTFNILTTAGGATAFQLPACQIGDDVIVTNPSATTALIFGQTSDTIQGGAANASFSVAQNKVAWFIKVAANTWAAILTA